MHVSIKCVAFLYREQRKGAKEQFDQNQSETGGLTVNNDLLADEDIVVDSIMEVDRDVKPYFKDLMQPGSRIISVEQAVLHSIDRCRKFPSVPPYAAFIY